MDTYNFILILDRSVDEATSDRLFEAGLDDAAITAFDGSPALDVDRDAPGLLEAIASAVRQAESVNGRRYYAKFNGRTAEDLAKKIPASFAHKAQRRSG